MTADAGSGQAGDITRLLGAISAGDAAAYDALVPLVYTELRSLARRRTPRSTGAGLDTTELVHETYLKLGASRARSWADRRHFFAVAARAMRQIVVDAARQSLAGKRGGAAVHVSIDDVALATSDRASELLDLDRAITRLGDVDARLVELVELRYFAGLSVEETAEALDTSPRTVKRDWRKARALLLADLHGTSDPREKSP